MTYPALAVLCAIILLPAPYNLLMFAIGYLLPLFVSPQWEQTSYYVRFSYRHESAHEFVRVVRNGLQATVNTPGIFLGLHRTILGQERKGKKQEPEGKKLGPVKLRGIFELGFFLFTPEGYVKFMRERWPEEFDDWIARTLMPLTMKETIRGRQDLLLFLSHEGFAARLPGESPLQQAARAGRYFEKVSSLKRKARKFMPIYHPAMRPLLLGLGLNKGQVRAALRDPLQTLLMAMHLPTMRNLPLEAPDAIVRVMTAGVLGWDEDRGIYEVDGEEDIQRARSFSEAKRSIVVGGSGAADDDDGDGASDEHECQCRAHLDHACAIYIRHEDAIVVGDDMDSLREDFKLGYAHFKAHRHENGRPYSFVLRTPKGEHDLGHTYPCEALDKLYPPEAEGEE